MTAVAGCFCFFLFQGRLELETITFRICFAAWLPRRFSGFFSVSVFPGPFFFCSCLNGVSVRVFVGLSVLGFPPLGVGWGVLGVFFFSPLPLACLLLLAFALAFRCVGKLGGSARNGPDPPPALGLARVALPVSCWESSATRAEPQAGGVFGFIATPSTTMIAILFPRGGGIHPQQNLAVSSEPGFVGSLFCWFCHLGVGLRCRL